MRIDVRQDKQHIGWKCILDGVDISRDCFAADDAEGWADCYVRNADGQKFLEGRDIKVERSLGHVQLLPPVKREG